MTRLAHVVLTNILAELPDDSELARVTKHTLDSLAYKAPEVAWMYVSERMAPALFEASELSPRPEWFGRVEAIWFGTDESTIERASRATEGAAE